MAWLCAGLGVVLLIAAGLKGHSLVTDFIPGKMLLLSRPVQFLTVEVELALGLWPLSGVGLVRAARVGSVFFLALAGASGWLLVSGVECCGCLGRLAVSPWFSFAFNLVAACGLVLTPKPTDDEPSRPGVAVATSSLFVFFGLLLPVAGWKEPIPAGRTLGSAGELVLLDTESWSGQQLPILDHLDVGGRLRRGSWLVVFFHRDCPKCERVIGEAARLARAGRLVAVVEVPPLSGHSASPPAERDGRVAWGRLASSRRWVIETPKVVRVEDGVVVRAGDGLDDVEGSNKEK